MGSRLGQCVVHFVNLPIRLLMPTPPSIVSVRFPSKPSSLPPRSRSVVSLSPFTTSTLRRSPRSTWRARRRSATTSPMPLNYKKAYVTLRHPLSLSPDLFPVHIVQEEREKIAQTSTSRPAVMEGSGKCSYWPDDPNHGLNRRDLPHEPKKRKSGVKQIGGGRGGPVKKVEESKFPWSNMRVAGSQRQCKRKHQKISAMISVPITKEGRRVEVVLDCNMEKGIKENVDVLWVNFKEENAKHEKLEKDHIQQVTSVVINFINKDLPVMLIRTIKKEISGAVRVISRAVTPAIEKSISSATADSFQRGVGDKTNSVNLKLKATVAGRVQSQF